MSNNNSIYNTIFYDFSKRINSFKKKNELSPPSKSLKKKSSNLILKFEKMDQNKDLKSSFQSKFSHKNLTCVTKSKLFFNNVNTNKQSISLFKSSPKNLLSSLENNVLLGKIYQTKSHLLPKISKNKKDLKMKNYNNYYIYNKNNEHKDKSIKNKFLSSSYKFTNSNKNNKNKNYCNNLFKEIIFIKSNEELCKNESLYTYIVRPENCGYLIKNCFKHRKNWKEIEDLESKDFNFKWQQTTRGIDYNHLSLSENKKQMVNHFEFLGVISNKANLFINMMQYAESKEQNIFKYLPFTVLFDYNKVNFFNKLVSFEHLFKNIDDYIVSYYEVDERNYKKDKDRLYGYFFPFIDRIGNKTVINIPDTHFVKNKIKIIDDSNNNENKVPKIKNNFWIIKAPDLNRGMCIKIVNNMMLIKRIIREYSMGIKIGYNDKNNNDENFNDFTGYNDDQNQSENYDDENGEEDNNYNYNFKYQINSIYNSNKFMKSNYESSPTKENTNNYRSHICVIQKYIEKPLLYYGRKFDIRIWVLLTQNLNVYMFEEGHLKCCSINYNLNSDNTFCHLTNYSFQKHSSNFGKYEFGNEVSFSDFQKNIDVNYDKKVNFKNDILPKINLKVLKIK